MQFAELSFLLHITDLLLYKLSFGFIQNGLSVCLIAQLCLYLISPFLVEVPGFQNTKLIKRITTLSKENLNINLACLTFLQVQYVIHYHGNVSEYI